MRANFDLHNLKFAWVGEFSEIFLDIQNAMKFQTLCFSFNCHITF